MKIEQHPASARTTAKPWAFVHECTLWAYGEEHINRRFYPSLAEVQKDHQYALPVGCSGTCSDHWVEHRGHRIPNPPGLGGAE
jgi:hypothetical protein